nr:MAG TPA: hypothetical protein [Bacteriophage sp.]
MQIKKTKNYGKKWRFNKNGKRKECERKQNKQY